MPTNFEFYMSANLSSHVGKWIAICNGSIVSEGSEPKKVFTRAKKKCPNKHILITRVPEEATMIF
ncbi:MAG: succinyl-CoA synthetase subunit alpha [Candidatus Altiarchaeales archaeon]|nr:succinyl-CoA synthetase subunit alpha [Candidatus Altiarchaeales archaeon]